MYIIRTRNSFKKDFKKIKDNPKFKKQLFSEVINMLSAGNFDLLKEMLYRSHKLDGAYKGAYDLHVQNDIVLIYLIDESKRTIKLIRIGTHSQLF